MKCLCKNTYKLYHGTFSQGEIYECTHFDDYIKVKLPKNNTPIDVEYSFLLSGNSRMDRGFSGLYRVFDDYFQEYIEEDVWEDISDDWKM